jgi:hypothetical protein
MCTLSKFFKSKSIELELYFKKKTKRRIVKNWLKIKIASKPSYITPT